MAEEKNLPLPEKELPPPHDMLLSPESKNEGQPGSGNNTSKPSGFSGNWEKYGSKKWLLPLLAFIGILILTVGISAMIGARDDDRTRSEKRQDRREKKRDRKEEKRDRKQNKNQKKKNKAGKDAKANADAGWTTFTYGTGENRIMLQYPGNMKVNTGTELGGIYGQTQVTTITFTDNRRTVKVQIVPNPNNLSLNAWHDQLASQKTEYAAPTEQVNGRELAVLQSVSNGTMTAFMATPSNSILWLTMTYSGNANAAKEEFVEMIKTIRFGGQPSGALPSLPANP